MIGHTVRGAVSAWLALIVLQTVATGGSGRVAALFGDVDRLVKRALDPAVPAIPDRGATPTVGPGTPFATAPSGAVLPGAHPGAQINPSTAGVVGFGY